MSAIHVWRTAVSLGRLLGIDPQVVRHPHKGNPYRIESRPFTDSDVHESGGPRPKKLYRVRLGDDAEPKIAPAHIKCVGCYDTGVIRNPINGDIWPCGCMEVVKVPPPNKVWVPASKRLKIVVEESAGIAHAELRAELQSVTKERDDLLAINGRLRERLAAALARPEMKLGPFRIGVER